VAELVLEYAPIVADAFDEDELPSWIPFLGHAPDLLSPVVQGLQLWVQGSRRNLTCLESEGKCSRMWRRENRSCLPSFELVASNIAYCPSPLRYSNRSSRQFSAA